MSPRRARGGDEEPEAPRWWDDAEHFVVLYKGIHASGAAEADEGERVRGTIIYEPGEEFPAEKVTPSMWSGVGDRLAALTRRGERLDTPAVAERRGTIDAEPALKTWRQENSLRRTTVERFVCEECGEEFETRDELNGHQSAHAEGETDDAESGVETETFADKLDADEGGEQA